ncbi:gas vesicle protein [Kitasatospora sp. NPDC054939]
MNDPDGAAPGPRPSAVPQRQTALIDLLDRLLSGGVVLTGDVILSIADVDLVRISLRALILSVSEQNPAPRMIGRPRAGNSHDR